MMTLSLRGWIRPRELLADRSRLCLRVGQLVAHILRRIERDLEPCLGKGWLKRS